MRKQGRESIDFSKLYTQIEAAIKSGQHAEAQSLFKLTYPKKIPREWASKYADLANRIHYSIFVLKVLHRFIFPENSFSTPASDEEKMTYANALANFGAVDEAIEILSSINVKKKPEAGFLTALTYFRKWGYAEAIPLLKDFISAPGVPHYRRVVGEVNLVASYIAIGEWDKALSLLSHLQHICRSENYNLLLGNCFELQAQVLFFQKKYDEALIALGHAEDILKEQKGLYLLFVEKWKILCKLFKAPNEGNKKELETLKLKATALEHNETIRECDLFLAIITNDEECLRQVIMGTPSEHYRQRARTLYGKNVKALGQCTWKLASSQNEIQETFDSYTRVDGKAALYEQPHLLALFEALTVDFYQPNHLGFLFKRIYPTEKFNPYTSPARVLQLLKRLDQWFVLHKTSLRVAFKKSEFTLKSDKAVGIIVRRGQKRDSSDGRWSEVKLAFKSRTFTIAKMCEVLDISNSSAQRLVKEALDEGRLKSQGRGRSTTYQLTTNKGKKAA